MDKNKQQLEWYRVADVDEVSSSRVKTMTAGIHSMVLTNVVVILLPQKIVAHIRADHLVKVPLKSVTMASVGYVVRVHRNRLYHQ